MSIYLSYEVRDVQKLANLTSDPTSLESFGMEIITDSVCIQGYLSSGKNQLEAQIKSILPKIRLASWKKEEDHIIFNLPFFWERQNLNVLLTEINSHYYLEDQLNLLNQTISQESKICKEIWHLRIPSWMTFYIVKQAKIKSKLCYPNATWRQDRRNYNVTVNDKLQFQDTQICIFKRPFHCFNI